MSFKSKCLNVADFFSFFGEDQKNAYINIKSFKFSLSFISPRFNISQKYPIPKYPVIKPDRIFAFQTITYVIFEDSTCKDLYCPKKDHSKFPRYRRLKNIDVFRN